MENQQFLSDIEDLLNDVESTPIEENSGEVDELVNEANSAFDGKKMEVITLQPEAKHQKAVDSQEPFELNLLSQDEKFNIRVLSACNPNISSGSPSFGSGNFNYLSSFVISNLYYFSKTNRSSSHQLIFKL